MMSQELISKEEKFGHIPSLIEKYLNYLFNFIVLDHHNYGDCSLGDYVYNNRINIKKYIKYNNLSIIKETKKDPKCIFNRRDLHINEYSKFEHFLKIDDKTVSGMSDDKIISEIKEKDLFLKLNKLFYEGFSFYEGSDLRKDIKKEWVNVLDKI